MKMQFSVPGMSCNHCKMRIEKALGKSEIWDLNVDLQSKKVTLESDLTPEDIIALLDEVGYDATLQ